MDVGEEERERRRMIEETVFEILKNADLDVMTEFKVRNMAAEKLRLDLNVPERKLFVRYVLESFLISSIPTTITTTTMEQQQEEQREEEVVAEEEEKPNIAADVTRTDAKFDNNGNRIICSLPNMTKVTVSDFRGKRLVSIRKYFNKKGEHCPTNQGISLTVEQWSTVRNAIPGIEEAIMQMKARLKNKN